MLKENEQKVLDAVSQERVVELCRKLVSIPTVNPYSGDKAPSGELEGLNFIEGVFKAMGANTRRIFCDDKVFDEYKILAAKGRASAGRHNVVAEFIFGDGKGPTILLDAHIDTVAVDNYTGDPYAATVADGHIHGRGSTDDKGGIAAMTEAVWALLDCPDGLSGKVICCAVIDEESDGAGRGTLSCLLGLPKPDLALFVDGDTCHIQDGCNGVVTARVTVPGKSGHSAYGAVNAIEQAVKLLPAFDTFRKLRGDRAGMFNFGVFQAGDHPANVPAKAALAFNIKTTLQDMEDARKVDGVDSGRLVRELFERCVGKIVAEDATLSTLPPQIKWTKDMPATSSSRVDARFLDFCHQAYVDATGCEPKVEPLAGWGDIAHFLRAGIPSVGIGPGVSGVAHSAQEKVSIAGLVDTAKVAALILARKLG